MRLLNAHNLRFEEFLDEGRLPEYAILSHTWHDKEVQYHHILRVDDYRDKENLDFGKIEITCRQAIRDGLKYVWIDTCCINKESSAELTEAINSMFRWYQKSAICYVYMVDVDLPEGWTYRALPGGNSYYIDHVNHVMTWKHPALCHDKYTLTYNTSFQAWARQEFEWRDQNRPFVTDDMLSGYFRQHLSLGNGSFLGSRWFIRGWTLQELIAPNLLRFYDLNGNTIGTLHDLIAPIELATRIPRNVLEGYIGIGQCSIAMRMSWAAMRKTTRPEDEAYCLLGIFDVNMPLLYGEGNKAFTRLQEEIIRGSTDQSILAWDRCLFTTDILAPSVARFAGCGSIHPFKYPEDDRTFEMTNRGLQIKLRACHTRTGDVFSRVALLSCLDTRQPGYYIALDLDHREIAETTSNYKVISVGLQGIVRIPYERKGSPLSGLGFQGKLDVALGKANWEELLLLRRSEPDFDPDDAHGIEVTIRWSPFDTRSPSECQGFPPAAWDVTSHESGTYFCHLKLSLHWYISPKILALGDGHGKTYVFAMSHVGSRALFFDVLLCYSERHTREVVKNLLSERWTAFYDRFRYKALLETMGQHTVPLSWSEKMEILFQPGLSDSYNAVMHITLDVVPDKTSISRKTLRRINSLLPLVKRRDGNNEFLNGRSSTRWFR